MNLQLYILVTGSDNSGLFPQKSEKRYQFEIKYSFDHIFLCNYLTEMK